MNIEKIIRILNRRYRVKIRRVDPFRVLIGTILSQRTKDEVTWPTNEKLFRVANIPQKFMKLTEKQIAKLIYPVGFYNQKAKNIRKLCKILIEKYDSKVPSAREELMQLPGVGGKTADCVLCFGYGVDVIPVDIHGEVLSKRLGIADRKDSPEKVREKLHALVPGSERLIVNHLFVEFGKEICQTRKPKCYVCPIVKLCQYEPKNL